MDMMLYLIAGFIVGAGGAGILFLLAARKTAEKQATMIAQNATSAAGLEAARTQLATAQAELIARDRTIAGLQRDILDRQAELSAVAARSEADARAAAEKLELLQNAELKLREAFETLSSQALRSNNQSFLDLARGAFEQHKSEAAHELETRKQSIENLVGPIRESLTRVDEQLRQLEGERKGAYAGLSEQVKQLNESQRFLQAETGNLVRALRSPVTRGRWGEIQLQRVVEMAGMLEHCDFVQQQTIGPEGGLLRPDLIVKLPGGKTVVVDAKAPLQAYLESVEAEGDDARRERLLQHAKQVREHIIKLGAKSYWEQLQPTPEFVVMFLPGETFFSAALEADPSLIEVGVKQGVIVASPVTLIALLRSVAYGWNQERIQENALQIAELGRDLYGRLCKFASHMDNVRRFLGRAVESHDSAVASLETRVFPAARRFGEMGVAAGAMIGELEPIGMEPRQLQLEPAELNGNGKVAGASGK
jgi:DNA recombination protein RmuC